MTALESLYSIEKTFLMCPDCCNWVSISLFDAVAIRDANVGHLRLPLGGVILPYYWVQQAGCTA
jgi:hypothetical protein